MFNITINRKSLVGRLFYGVTIQNPSSQTVVTNILVVDCNNINRKLYEYVHFAPHQSVCISESAPKESKWKWSEGDNLFIIDSYGRVVQQWVFQSAQYEPQNCPYCHGTGVCPTCSSIWAEIKKALDKGFQFNDITHPTICPTCNNLLWERNSVGVCPYCHRPQANIWH